MPEDRRVNRPSLQFQGLEFGLVDLPGDCILEEPVQEGVFVLPDIGLHAVEPSELFIALLRFIGVGVLEDVSENGVLFIVQLDRAQLLTELLCNDLLADVRLMA